MSANRKSVTSDLGSEFLQVRIDQAIDQFDDPLAPWREGDPVCAVLYSTRWSLWSF